MIIEPSPEDIERYTGVTEPKKQTFGECITGFDPARGPDMSSIFQWRVKPQLPFVETPWRQPSNALVDIKYMMLMSSMIVDRPEYRAILPGITDGGPSWTDEEQEAYYLKEARIATILLKNYPGNKHRKDRRLIRRYRKRVGKLAPGPEWIEYYKDHMRRKLKRLQIATTKIEGEENSHD